MLGLLVAGQFALQAQPADSTVIDPRKALAYRIATNDRIRIGVFQEPDLDMIGRVDMKGTINLHLLGAVKLIGMTISEAEKTVQEAYRNGRYLRNPQVAGPCCTAITSSRTTPASSPGSRRAPTSRGT